MDYTKSIKNELIDIWDKGQTKATLAWYDRAKKTNDIIEQDYYNNCAIFRNKTIARQETLKVHQKDYHNKVFSHDSGAVIVYFDTSRFGIDLLHLKRSNSKELEVEGGLNPKLICDFSRGNQWMSEYSREDSIESSLNLLKFFKDTSNHHPSVKLVVAWIIYTTRYDQVLKPEWLGFWKSEFRLFEIISDTYSIVYKQCLWMYSKYSRYIIRKAFILISSELHKYLDIYPKVKKFVPSCGICDSKIQLNMVKYHKDESCKIYLCDNCLNKRKAIIHV